jgi:hypothetical protein
VPITAIGLGTSRNHRGVERKRGVGQQCVAPAIASSERRSLSSDSNVHRAKKSPAPKRGGRHLASHWMGRSSRNAIRPYGTCTSTDLALMNLIQRYESAVFRVNIVGP